MILIVRHKPARNVYGTKPRNLISPSIGIDQLVASGDFHDVDNDCIKVSLQVYYYWSVQRLLK
jgi:hypothetical protein